MTTHLRFHKVTYFSVPKVACTSLKHFFFEIQNGFAFRNFRINGRLYRIHGLVKSLPFETVPHEKIGNHVKLTVVRDPWQRILSCYTSKVLKNNQLRTATFTPKQTRLGLVHEPTLDQFVDQFDAYREFSWEIRHHSRPLSYFLGTDPGYFDEIYPISRVADLRARVAEIIKKPVPDLPHRNTSKSFAESLPQDMIARNRKKIEDRFAEDQELFGAYM